MKEITRIQTPFPQKFGIPRQPLLIDEAVGKLVFPKNDFYSEAFRGLESFSHLWLIFEFSEVPEANHPALVYPPRFEGKTKLGVYATRSPHRPNRIGLSVVKFDRLEVKGAEVILWVRGVDLLDGTPILDIKPYVPYCDSVPDARADLFSTPPSFLPVIWISVFPGSVELKALVEKVVGLDPRPSQDKSSLDSFGVSVGGYNVRFRFEGNGFEIFEVTRE